MAQQGSSRFYEGVESAAKFHKASVYDGLLSFHNAVFETGDDSLASQYVPLTTTKLKSRTEILPFIVGILPPANPPTGRLVSRGPVADQTPKPTSETGSTQNKPGPNLPSPPDGDKIYNPIQLPRFAEYENARKDKKKYPAGGRNEQWAGMWANTGDFDVPHSRDPKHRHQGVDLSTTKGTPLIAAWNGVVTKVGNESTNKIGGNSIRISFQKNGKQWEVYYAHMDTVGVNVGDTVTAGQNVGTVGDSGIAKNTQAHLHLEVRIDGQLVDPYKHIVDSVPVEGGPVLPDANTSNFATDGSKNAQAAAQSQAALNGKQLNGGTQPDPSQASAYTNAQASTIAALQAGYEAMKSTPPLQLLINPESFSVSNQKIITDGNWGRNGSGTGIEHWGDAQDTISASGRVAGFFALQASGATGSSGNGPGVTRMARNFSLSYENLLSLYLIYRNNGALWIPDYSDASGAQTVKPNHMATVGSVYIYYDNVLYIGSFDSFQMSEDDTAPFTLSYSFDFTVRATFLLDRVGNENPNPGTDYGAPQFFNPRNPSPPATTVTPGAATPSPAPPPGGASVPVPPGTTINQANQPPQPQAAPQAATPPATPPVAVPTTSAPASGTPVSPPPPNVIVTEGGGQVSFGVDRLTVTP